MENLNKALEDLLIHLKEINRQTADVMDEARKLQKMYADDYMEMVADQETHVMGHRG